jgi:hypothetical protein
VSKCSYETLRKYITALAFAVKETADTVPRFNLRNVQEQTILTVMERNTWAKERELSETSEFDDIIRMIKEGVSKLDVGTMLRYCFVAQQQRLTDQRALERRLGMLLPQTNRTVSVLVKIAAELRKLELGDAYLTNQGILRVKRFQPGITP